MCLDVGGFPVSLSSAAPFPPETRKRYGAFLTRGRAKLRLRLRSAAPPLPGGWRPRIRGRGGRLCCESSQFHLDLELAGSGAFAGRGRGDYAGSPQALDSLLRVLYSRLLPASGGVLLHAAAFRRQGAAYLFAGPSGAGKTTLMRKLSRAPGVRFLSDELVLLRREGSALTAHSTPFWGEFRQPENNGRAPLRRIFTLARSRTRTRIRPLAFSRAQSRLLRCLVGFSDEREPLEKGWDVIAGAALSHPPEELRWRKGESAESLLGKITGENP